jgi:hypothetical protein
MKIAYGSGLKAKGRVLLSNRKALSAAMIPAILLGVFVGVTYKPATRAASTLVPGQNYLICDQGAQYLTSPWTYHALGSGSQTYTVAQYKALVGYGTTLPPLPAYIANQSSATPAAVIYAPGASVTQPAYNFPENPIMHFFEGGSYGMLAMQSQSGDLYIGGSSAGFPLPKFDSAGSSGGVDAENDSYGQRHGAAQLATVTAGLAAGTKSITFSSSRLPIVPWEIIVINGHQYQVQAVSGAQTAYTLTIGGLDAAVTAGTPVYYEAPATKASLNTTAWTRWGTTGLTCLAPTASSVITKSVTLTSRLTPVAAAQEAVSGGGHSTPILSITHL